MTDHKPSEPSPADFKETPARSPESEAASAQSPGADRADGADEAEAHPS